MASEIRISTIFYVIGETLYFARDIGEKPDGSGTGELQTTDDNLNELLKDIMGLLGGGQ